MPTMRPLRVLRTSTEIGRAVSSPGARTWFTVVGAPLARVGTTKTRLRGASSGLPQHLAGPLSAIR